MTRLSKSILLLGTAILSLSACSGDKGPGAIGSKDDIVVRNQGQPAPESKTAAAPATQGGDFSSTVEQAQANPAPEVAAAEPLPDTSPAVEQAVKEHEEATAPLPNTAEATPPDAKTAAISETRPLDAVAPTTPVTNTTTPPPAEATATATAPASTAPAAGTVYPAADTAAPATAQYPSAIDQATPVPTPAPAPVATTSATPGPSAVPPGVKYPLDANAPFSPKAVAAAAAAAGTTATTPAAPVTGNVNDAATIKAAQTALKTKGAYTGAETGEIDAAFLNALIMYQAQNNLPQGGLNEATLKSLGVIQ